jgi:hypothetical protein
MSPGPLRLESRSDFINLAQSEKGIEKNRDFVPGKDGQEQDEEDEGVSMSTIQVPRQKYIPVSKAELLDAIVLMMFESQQDDGDDAHHFLLLSS